MNRLQTRDIALAAGLSGLAGFVDAIGFLRMRGTFVSFMSGNSTQMAVDLGRGNLHAVALLCGIISLFVVGAALGSLVRRFRFLSAAVAVLAAVTVLLSGAALFQAFGWAYVAISLMTLAMGAVNAVFQRDGEVVVGLTYMTGTLVKIGQKFADSLFGGAAYAWVPYFVLWAGLILGGVLGALAFSVVGLNSLGIAVGWAGLLTLYASLAQVGTDRTVHQAADSSASPPGSA